MRREAAAHAGLHRDASQLRTHGTRRPGPAACRSVDDAEQVTHGEFGAGGGPRPQLFPAPVVHADLAALSAFAVADEQRTAAFIEVALGEVERFGDPKPRAPEHDDQAAQAVAVDARTGVAHHRNDLLDSRRICWIAQTLVARWTPSVIARKRRRGASPAGDVDQGWGGHGSSDHRFANSPNGRYHPCHAQAARRPVDHRSAR
jgi:hypothetical protein